MATGTEARHMAPSPVEGKPAKPAKQPMTMARLKDAGRAWFARYNGVACVAVALAFFAVVLGIFLFCAFSDFGGSADFIYNQF